MNVAFIPIRGGSKSIPLKNIKPMAGKPLVYWVIKAASECTAVDKIYVSTDSDIIRDTVLEFSFPKVKVISRSVESAIDIASTEYGMLEFASEYDFTNIALIQATSPLLTGVDLQRGFDLLSQDDVDSVLSVVRQKRFLWSETESGYAEPQNYDVFRRPLRQDFNGFLVENGAFYITSCDLLIKNKCRLSSRTKTIEMTSESYIELDEPEDWIVVESFLLKRERFLIIPEIKMFLSDCDGTLTDGGMYYSSDGEVMKKFNTRDGVGLRLLQERGIITGIITGEESNIVRKRAKKIGVNEVLLGVIDKVAAITRLCEKHGINLDNVAYIGDDLNDLDAIKTVGFGICVCNAVDDVKKAADFVTKTAGGNGSVREAAELVMMKGV